MPHLSLYVKEPNSSTQSNGNTELPDQQTSDNVNNNTLNVSGFSHLSLLSQNSDEDARVNKIIVFKFIYFIVLLIK